MGVLEVGLIFWLGVIWIVPIVLNLFLAQRKARNRVIWAICGLLFSYFSTLALVCAESKKQTSGITSGVFSRQR